MKQKKYKLYVWTNVLADYTAGMAFGYATSPEHAKRMLIKNGLRKDHFNGIKLDGQEPIVTDKGFASFVHGGG